MSANSYGNDNTDLSQLPVQIRNHSNFSYKLADYFKRLDVFGQTISLTYKGEQHY